MESKNENERCSPVSETPPIEDLPLYWQGWAKAIQLMNSKRVHPDEGEMRQAAAYEKCAEELRASLRARSSAATVTVPVDAIVNLVNHQQQCDMDGVMVQVSRQALCEVLAYVTEVRPDNKWADDLAQPSQEQK